MIFHLTDHVQTKQGVYLGPITEIVTSRLVACGEHLYHVINLIHHDQPVNKKNDRSIYVRLPASIHERIQYEASNHDVPMSTYIRLVMSALSRNGVSFLKQVSG